MIINRNSFHARVYKYVHGDKLPDNLCPYFWKMLFALIWCIPDTVIRFPGMLLNRFTKDSGMERTKGVVLYFFSLILIWMGWCITELIKFLLGFEYDEDQAFIGGMCIVVPLLGLLVYQIIKYFCEPKERGTIVGEFIKAKYERYCPRIIWIENNVEKK